MTTEEDVIKALVGIAAAPREPREHYRCCDICERGTAHFIGDDEASGLIHVVAEDGHEMWMPPEDFAAMKKLVEKKR